MSKGKVFGRKTWKYRRKLMNTCIMRIRYGNRSERTINGYKTFVFKSMKEIVHKNIMNYLNLLNSTSCRDLPEYDEVLSECYLIFEKCLWKFKIKKNNNFYFYFNKALSRNFYRYYQKETNHSNVELSPEISLFHPSLQQRHSENSISMIMHHLQFSELEIRITNSRLSGERISEFLKRNSDITQKQYIESLKHIKSILLNIKDKEQWQI